MLLRSLKVYRPNAQNVALVDLPYELRLAIYEAVLLSNQELLVDFASHSENRHYRPASNRKNKLAITAILLETCKAVYTAASPILYGRKAFSFTSLTLCSSEVSRLMSDNALSQLTNMCLQPMACSPLPFHVFPSSRNRKTFQSFDYLDLQSY